MTAGGPAAADAFAEFDEDDDDEDNVHELVAHIPPAKKMTAGSMSSAVSSSHGGAVTNGAVAGPRICAECRQQKSEHQGKVDEADGSWYCHSCWQSFYNGDEAGGRALGLDDEDTDDEETNKLYGGHGQQVSSGNIQEADDSDAEELYDLSSTSDQM